MRQFLFRLVMVLGGLGMMTGLAYAQEAGRYDVRGLGAVTVSTRYFGEGAKRTSWVTFEAEDAQHATVIGSKFLADLGGFGDVKPQTFKGGPATVLALEGSGYWRLGLDGNKCQVLFARQAAELADLVKQSGGDKWLPVPARAYPRWLDCFDNSSVASWWGGGGAPTELPNDFQWAKDHGWALCSQPPTESRYVAPGVIDTSITDWFGAMAAQYDVPYRTLLWPEKPRWVWNRTPLPHVRPYEKYIAYPWMEYQQRGVYDAFEPVPTADRYVLDFRRRFAAQLVNDPNFMGHHGGTEMPSAGILELAAVAAMPEVKAFWHSYLVNTLGQDLQGVGLLHKGRRDAYKSWDEVAVPLPHDFLGGGYNAASVNLAGRWEGKVDRARAGTQAKWYNAPGGTAETAWVAVDCNDPMILIYSSSGYDIQQKLNIDYWLRRTVTVTPEQLPALRYLHIARSNWHGSQTPSFAVYVNGQEIKEGNGGFDQFYDIGKALVAGPNQIVLNTHGAPVPGYIFLSTLPRRAYPYMTEPENRLWFDMVNFDATLRVGTTENTLRAMRLADPNRPLKLMANINLLDLTQDLCERYGAYQHDTGGAASYWCPMTGARLAKANGLPWSCEQGGPPSNVAEMQAALTYYLMYGCDAVDLVFGVTHYRDNKEVAAWVDSHRAWLECMGKMSLPLPAIGILRSTRGQRLGFDEPWNWDLGRGILQAVGRNFAYAETPEISNGRLRKYQVVIDDGTLLMTDDEIEGIKRYVRNGGTFVAQHHTGRHSPGRADTWALAVAFGLKVEPKLMNAENYHKWPLGKIRFTKEQTVFPSLRGQACEGSGVAIDYKNEEHTGAVALRGQGEGIAPVANWEDGTMAVTEVKLGKGRLIYLGTPFYLRMRDSQGKWINQQDLQGLVDEMLTGLGAPRDSWTNSQDLWAEHWTSKNGVYDLYPLARMTAKGEGQIPAQVSLRREQPIKSITELSGQGHPATPVTWKEGKFTLDAGSFGFMQSKVFAAPCADGENAALRWFEGQRQLWRALPAIPAVQKPEVINTPADILSVNEGWQVTTGQTDQAWIGDTAAGATWKTVKLGSFAAMGFPEEAVVQCRKEIMVPAGWKGQHVNLVFDPESWFWGLGLKANFWINGKPAALKQPIVLGPQDGFTLDVTELPRDGKLVLALELDGRLAKPTDKRSRPSGVLGAFYLQAEALAVATVPLAGPWRAASDLNVFTPAEVGKLSTYVYLETRFTLSKEWPAQRVFLGAPVHLGWLILNDQVVSTPAWMRQLDISGLVRRDGGANVLRWVPASTSAPDFKRVHNLVVPELNVIWYPEAAGDAAK